jgi:hypothetical protein
MAGFDLILGTGKLSRQPRGENQTREKNAAAPAPRPLEKGACYAVGLAAAY